MKRICLLYLLAVVGCASAGSGGPVADPAGASSSAALWPVRTRIHLDLWLHGYAMLLRDSAKVPVFSPGYRDRVQAEKNRRGLNTLLDANREQLQSRLSISPALTNGQFAPLYFGSFDQMKTTIDRFIQAQGDPRAAGDQAMAQYFAILGQSFPTGADREWLRLFTLAVEDERRQFYQEYWTSQNGARLGVVRAADSLWQSAYRPRFQGFLNNTQQETGDFLLALTLGGEGRTVNFSARQNAIAVTMPATDPLEAIYVFAHEVVNSIVGTAVHDNITPTEQRAGTGAQYVLTGTVRAGAMLLQRIAPELVTGYTRYYLTQARASTTGDINARLASTYPLPQGIHDAINRQLDVVLGGI